jgi:hypothetical protein
MIVAMFQIQTMCIPYGLFSANEPKPAEELTSEFLACEAKLQTKRTRTVNQVTMIMLRSMVKPLGEKLYQHIEVPLSHSFPHTQNGNSHTEIRNGKTQSVVDPGSSRELVSSGGSVCPHTVVYLS